MKRQLFSLAALAAFYSINAQQLSCGTADISYEQFISQRDLAENIRASKYNSKNIQVITYIPVKMHLFGNDDGTLYANENNLNNALAEANRQLLQSNIQLYFKGTDFSYYPNSNFNSGTMSTAERDSFHSQNASNDAVNMYAASVVMINSSGVGGYAYVTPTTQQYNMIYIRSSYFDDDKTTPHEVGHYFGLAHTFNNSTSPTVTERELVTRNFNETTPRLNANCNTKGDFICDTPSDPRDNGNAAVTNCVYSGTVTDANNDLFAPYTNNIMDYNFCSPYYFTQGQNDRMQYTGIPIVTNATNYTLNAPETPQPVPTNITSTNSDYSNQFVLNWTDNSSVESGYLIEAKAEGSSNYISVKGVMKNINNAVNFSKLTPGIKYNFRIKASNTKTNYSAESPLIQIPMLCGNNNETACSPNTATSANYNLENVKISQNNVIVMQNLNSNCSGGSIGNYYATHIANLTAGMSATVDAKGKAGSNGSAYTCYVKVYVDWNKDSIFDEATEKVIEKSGFNGMTDNFLIPSTVSTGSYRMRISLSASNFANTGSCKVSFGEIEDYQLAINNSSLSVKETEAEKSGFYPNPVNDILYIKSSEKFKKYKIYSAEGRLVLQGEVKENQINASTLAKGYYFVECYDRKNNILRSKIIKN